LGFRLVEHEYRKLSTENFFRQNRTPMLKELMKKINSFFVVCSCTACIETGRYVLDPRKRHREQDACSFTPYWEELLDVYGIPFGHRQFDGPLPLDDFSDIRGACMLSSPHALVNVNISLGCPLGLCAC
jgi:hypothetical protein